MQAPLNLSSLLIDSPMRIPGSRSEDILHPGPGPTHPIRSSLDSSSCHPRVTSLLSFCLSSTLSLLTKLYLFPHSPDSSFDRSSSGRGQVDTAIQEGDRLDECDSLICSHHVRIVEAKSNRRARLHRLSTDLLGHGSMRNLVDSWNEFTQEHRQPPEGSQRPLTGYHLSTYVDSALHLKAG